MSDRAWKRVEREVARILSAARIPVTGRHGPGGDPGDVALPGYYVEVRRRKRVELWSWWNLTMAEAAGRGVRPLMVVKQAVRGGQLVAVLRLHDLAEVMHGQVAPRAPRPAPPDPTPQDDAGAAGRGRGDDHPRPFTRVGYCGPCGRIVTFTRVGAGVGQRLAGDRYFVEQWRCPRGHREFWSRALERVTP